MKRNNTSELDLLTEMLQVDGRDRIEARNLANIRLAREGYFELY